MTAREAKSGQRTLPGGRDEHLRAARCGSQRQNAVPVERMAAATRRARCGSERRTEANHSFWCGVRFGIEGGDEPPAARFEISKHANEITPGHGTFSRNMIVRNTIPVR
jgi:hypothetical protein